MNNCDHKFTQTDNNWKMCHKCGEIRPALGYFSDPIIGTSTELKTKILINNEPMKTLDHYKNEVARINHLGPKLSGDSLAKFHDEAHEAYLEEFSCAFGRFCIEKADSGAIMPIRQMLEEFKDNLKKQNP